MSEAIIQREAIKLSGEVEKASREFAKSGLLLARMLDECRQKQVHTAMGMTWESWVEKFCAHSLSDVRRKLQISRGLAGLPTKELCMIPESNAYALLKLPPGERTKRIWLDKAMEMPVDKFRGAVDKATGKNGSDPEEWATFSILVRRPLYNTIREAEAKVAGLLGADIGKQEQREHVWDAISGLILATEPEHLMVELRGGA